MSSNQNSNNEEKKKMTSISRKLRHMMSADKLGRAFGGWFSMSAGLPFCMVAFEEVAQIGEFDLSLIRTISATEGVYDAVYTVADSSANVLLSYNLFPTFVFSMSIATGVFLLRMLNILFTIGKRKRKIRRILRPIDEIAIRADELSSLEYKEGKFQDLENALYSIEPEDSSEISLNDSELQGVENAMNNLIRRMKESYRQQARFVNDASHELRTPIAVIEGYANMISRWGKEDEKVLDESIAAIQNESSHMKHLVEQLLFLARGDSGKTALKYEEISLNNLLKEIYEESLMIDEKHVYRFTDWKWDMKLTADSGLLKQAVRILVDNAAKYTTDGDEIILSCGVNENNRPYLQVQDTGIGMKQQDVEHMFERFYRADKARNTEGTGLGLSIAKWIIDKHDGHFEITSREELGTRIRIVL